MLMSTSPFLFSKWKTLRPFCYKFIQYPKSLKSLCQAVKDVITIFIIKSMKSQLNRNVVAIARKVDICFSLPWNPKKEPIFLP